MRKRFGAREFAAAVLIVGASVVYWIGTASPPVTLAPDSHEATTEGAP